MTPIADHVRLRALLSLLALLTAIVGVSSFQASIGGVLLVAGFLGLPLGGYITLIRSRMGSLACGLALLTLAIWTQVYVSAQWERGSSTAGLGYLNLPVYGFALVGVTGVTERIVAGLKQEDEREG